MRASKDVASWGVRQRLTSFAFGCAQRTPALSSAPNHCSSSCPGVKTLSAHCNHHLTHVEPRLAPKKSL